MKPRNRNRTWEIWVLPMGSERPGQLAQPRQIFETREIERIGKHGKYKARRRVVAGTVEVPVTLRAPSLRLAMVAAQAHLVGGLGHYSVVQRTKKGKIAQESGWLPIGRASYWEVAQ